MFDCRACEETARRGGDLRAELSGKERSCEGPKVYPFFASHPSGGFVWHGCPRTAATPRVMELLRVFDRCDGRLSYTEQRLAPGVLVDAFGVVEFAQAVRRWQDAKDAEAKWQRKPGR
jgi:hypothetical protein